MEELKVDKAKQTLDAGKSLAWAGAIIGWISGRIVGAGYVAGLIGILLGIALSIFGCYWWAKGKGRSPAFMLWGVLAPIGFLGVALLKNKNKQPEEKHG